MREVAGCWKGEKGIASAEWAQAYLQDLGMISILGRERGVKCSMRSVAAQGRKFTSNQKLNAT